MILLNSQGKTSTPLLTKQRISISSSGGLIALHVGNVKLEMPYDAALQLGTMLRVHAKKEKRYVGDNRHWSVIGMLEDAEAIVKETQARRWA